MVEEEEKKELVLVRAPSRQDVILAMQSKIDEYEKMFSQFASQKSSFMLDNALENIDHVKAFQAEVQKEAKAICAEVKELRSYFANARGTDDNYDGFLCSNVDEYMPLLEPEFKEMSRLLDTDQQHWEKEAEKPEAEKVQQNMKMVELLSNLRNDVTTAIQKKQTFTRLEDLNHY